MIEYLQTHILAVLVFFPLVGILAVLAAPSEQSSFGDDSKIAKKICLLVFLTEFVLSLHLPVQYISGGAVASTMGGESFRFLQAYHLPGLPFDLTLGVDGISLWLILLTTFLMPLVVLGSWNQIQEKVKGFLICILLIQTSVLGTLVSLNLVLFYVFWELMIIPMFLIIGVWGTGRNLYSAIKFFLFTGLGSLFMLVAIIYLYANHGTANLFGLLTTNLTEDVQYWCFLAFGLAFAVKIPVFPFHTWLPDAHTDAPTGGSVVLAGLLLKMGAYGFLRFAIPLFPLGFSHFQIPLILLGIIGILYGALLCLVQDDMKRLIAYSSISHLGFVVFGIGAYALQATTGALFLMISHGLTTGGLFLLIGMIYERRHTRNLEEYGGLGTVLPVYTFFFVFIGLASIGLPGLSGFVGEFLVLLGGFNLYSSFYTFFAAFGIILAAWYMLRLFSESLFGPVTNPNNKRLDDLSFRELVVIFPIGVLVLVLGFFPGLLIEPARPSLHRLIEYEPVRQVVESNHAQPDRTDMPEAAGEEDVSSETH